jgi:hypothetical protein
MLILLLGVTGAQPAIESAKAIDTVSTQVTNHFVLHSFVAFHTWNSCPNVPVIELSVTPFTWDDRGVADRREGL